MKRAKSSEPSSSASENKVATIQSHIVGHIDNGTGFYYPDLAFEAPCCPEFQSRALFLIDDCPALTLERLRFTGPKWTIVDNLTNNCIIVQRNDAVTLLLASGNKPCIVSNTENTKAPSGVWMHGCTPLDQELLQAYYNEIIDILPTDHYKKNSVVCLVLCLFPLKLLRLSWN